MNGLKRMNAASAVPPGRIGVSCHNDDEQDSYCKLCQIVDELINIYEVDSRPFPD